MLAVGPDVRVRQWPVILPLLIAAVLPNVIWIATDKAPWPWDQAYYGKSSIELFYTLVHAPSSWPHAMLTALGRMAPGLVWMGQGFVAIGLAIGSIDAGLLLSIVLCQVAAVWLMAAAAGELANGSLRAALTALWAMASTPFLIALSHYYVVEMMQTAAVALFVFIMARAPTASRLMIAGQLVLATSMAMLTKVSSPLYCFGPGLVCVYYLLRGTPDGNRSRDGRPVVIVWVLAVSVAALTAAWYYRNITFVSAHVAMATSGTVAELYGKKATFLSNLGYWLSAVRIDFLSPIVAILAAASFAGAVVVTVVTRQSRSGAFVLSALVAVIQIAVVLSAFSLNSNRDNRYLLPLLPYVVLVVCWSVYRLERRIVAYAMLAAFVVQWGQSHVQALSIGTPALTMAVPWLNPTTPNARGRALLETIAKQTCTPQPSEFRWNAVGVQLLWLNPPGVSYAAAKALAPSHTWNCDFEAIGYFDSDVDRSWAELMSKSIAYYITVDPNVHKIPETPVDQTINQLNGPILRRIESSGHFQLERGVVGEAGILVYKRVDRITAGRTLFGLGRLPEAIAEFTEAAKREPANVEAWANLANAFEYVGDAEQAIAAGLRAKTLASGHYYVNLVLARALLRQQQWTTAVERATDAVANAPGVPERVDALALAAQAAFHGRDTLKGCDFLRTAATLQSRAEIQHDLSSHRCVK
jgi:Tetratricopeptide repeat